VSGRKPWSLSGRLTRLFLFSNLGFVLLIAVGSVVFVRNTVRRELDGIVHEQLGELASRYESLRDDRAALERELLELAEDHAPARFGWRIWRSDGTVESFGDLTLLGEDRPDPERLGESVEEPGEIRWLSETMSNGDVAGVAFDGTPQIARLRQYEVSASIVVAGGLITSVVVALYLSRRLTRLLAQVAQRAREVRDPAVAFQLDIPDAPIEIQQVSTALREMLENIRRETQQARIFTAGLAHELRSPVQNLVGETEVALIQERDGAAYREVLRSNLEELRALGDAIDNLVTICSAGDTQRTVARERFDLAVEAGLRLRRERSHAERHGVELAFETAGDCSVTGDREALLRAVRNLTANAIQWSPPGTRVRVALAGEGEHVSVTVDDAGPGVPEELRERIFEPFFRGPATHGRRIGYGLGLALARMAAEEQQGTIEVGRSPLGGARFHLRFPRRGRERS
jgi:signal transduction histidine kinase